MPVSYDQSQLLKCTARMAYSRYFIEDRPRGVIPRFLNALGSRGGRQGPEFNNGLEVPSNPAFGFGSRTDNFVRIDSRSGERRSGTR